MSGDRPPFAGVQDNADIRRDQIVEQLSKMGLSGDSIREFVMGVSPDNIERLREASMGFAGGAAVGSLGGPVGSAVGGVAGAGALLAQGEARRAGTDIPSILSGALTAEPDGTPSPILNKFSNSLAGFVTELSGEMHSEAQRGRDAFLAPIKHRARQERLLQALDEKVAQKREDISGMIRVSRGANDGEVSPFNARQIKSSLDELNRQETKARENIGKLDTKFKAGTDQRMRDLETLGLDMFLGAGITKKVGGKVASIASARAKKLRLDLAAAEAPAPLAGRELEAFQKTVKDATQRRVKAQLSNADSAKQQLQELMDRTTDPFTRKQVQRNLDKAQSTLDDVVRNNPDEVRELNRIARATNDLSNPKSSLSARSRKINAQSRQSIADEGYSAADKAAAFNTLSPTVRQAVKQRALLQFKGRNVGPKELATVAEQRFSSQLLTALRKGRKK